MRPWAHVHLKVGSAWEESNHLGNPHSVITVAFCLNLTAGFQIASTFSLEEGEGFCILLVSTSFFPLVLFRFFFTVFQPPSTSLQSPFFQSIPPNALDMVTIRPEEEETPSVPHPSSFISYHSPYLLPTHPLHQHQQSAS